MVILKNIWSDMKAIWSQTFVCKLKLSFLNIFSKTPQRNHTFPRFFYAKINCCLYFTRKKWKIIDYRVLTLWRHSDIIYFNGWYLFWYQWKEDIPSRLIIGGGLQQPLRKICLGKMFRRTRVKHVSLSLFMYQRKTMTKIMQNIKFH